MSAKKVTESTKFAVDESTDSGFLSGPVSEQLSSDDLDTHVESDRSTEVRVTSDKKVEEEEDQGLCLLTDELEIADTTPVAQLTPLLVPLPVAQAKAPPAGKPAPAVSDDEALRLRELLFSQDADGDTPLHIAAVHGCTKSVGMLIKLCPEKAWLDIPNDYGHTALHLAIMSKNVVVARMLVMAGAALTVRDHMGETPLHTAVSTGQQDCILALVDPAPGLQRIRSPLFDQKNYNGQACVHLAASAGRVDLLQTLVFYGADVNIREGRAGWTPLHIAARRCDDALAQYLLHRCAGVARAARDYAGRTPRRLARRSRLAGAFSSLDTSDTDDDDEEDDDYESDSEELFEKLSGAMTGAPIDVV